MAGMALHSASKGRLRPSFFLLLGLCTAAMAQQAVYRCGQEYTNAPADPRQCERLPEQPAVTVIPGTRVQAATAAPAPSSAATVSAMPQRQRDAMARSVLQAELEQTRERHQRLLQEYRQGEPERLPEETLDPQRYRERVARLQAAVERAGRDVRSLEREIARLPAQGSVP